MAFSLPDATPFRRDALRQRVADDPRQHAILGSTGVYVDERGRVGHLPVRDQVLQQVAAEAHSPNYTDVLGWPAFRQALTAWVPGQQAQASVCQQVLGGTGGLLTALTVLARTTPAADRPAHLWLTDPTWGNHHAIAAAAGVPTCTVPWGPESTRPDAPLDLAAIHAALADAQPGDAVLLHAANHNPTGLDPTPEAWRLLGQVLAERQLVLLLDVAFWGYADTPREELAGAGTAAKAVLDAGGAVAWLFSLGKTFGWYDARLGGVVWQASTQRLARLTPHLQWIARARWSSPPTFAARVVTALWSDAAATQAWQAHLAAVRQRLNTLRSQAAELFQTVPIQDRQRWRHRKGLFVPLDLNARERRSLQEHEALYLAGPNLNLTTLWGPHMARIAQRLCQLRAPHAP